MNDVTFDRFQGDSPGGTMSAMDTLGMVILAISALALLEVAAVNLRGPERQTRPRRSPAARR